MSYKMKGFSGFGNSPAKKKFEPHNMYDKKKAETHKEHLALKKKGYSHSPLKKKYDFKKTKDYTKKSKDYTKQDPGNIGSKIAKAVTPTSFLDVIPFGKVVKGTKAAYKFFTS